MSGIDIRAKTPADAAYLTGALGELMAGTSVAGHEELTDAMPLDGLIAWIGDEPVGHLTYRADDTGWEVVTLGADRPGIGVGRALMTAVLDAARAEGVTRVWLITTNDNTRALRFYQRCGFDLVALHRDAVTRSRETLKPAIPTHNDDIPVRHELELEWRPSQGAGTGRSGR
jgi:GNAT superfamily N-acetyltransferase